MKPSQHNVSDESFSCHEMFAEITRKTGGGRDMMAYFGRRYPAPAYADCPQTETPVGEPCNYCTELFQLGDDGWVLHDGSKFHTECNLRMVVGSVAHQEKRCSCYGGNGSDVEDSMSKREGAKAAMEAFVTRGNEN
jgi:hypothetical protein